MRATAAPKAVSAIVSALDGAQDCVRYLNTRRSKRPIIALESEEDIQDLLFLMLRPLIPDIIPENPTEKKSSRYTIRDFYARSLNLVLEAKFIRDRRHGKEISREIHDDIEMYRNHERCSHIIFFIYDLHAWIPDTRSLIEQVQGIRNYDGKQIRVYCIIKP